MKKIVIILFIVVCGVHTLEAQKKWSLSECINYALDNNIDVKQKELTKQNAKIDLNTSKMERLPNLNASIGENFNFGRSQLSDGIYQSVNSNNTSFGVTSSMPIFTGFRIKHNIDSKKFSLMSSEADLQTTKENIELNITGLYLDALFKKEILKVYEDQLASNTLQVEKTKALVEAGKVARSQEYDILAQQAKDELNITTAKNDLDLSLLNLSQALNLESYDDFAIVEPSTATLDLITDNVLLPSPNNVYETALAIKPHVKVAEYDLESRKSNLGVAKAGYYPTLSLSGGYKTSYNSQGSDAFFNQLKNLRSEYISLSLSIPIFNRFQTRNQVRTAKLNIEAGELNVINTRQNLFKDIQQAYQQAKAAQSKYVSTKKALEAAQESYNYAVMRYDVGNFTAFELNDAQLKLLSSKSDLVQSKYDYIFKTKILDFYKGQQITLE